MVHEVEWRYLNTMVRKAMVPYETNIICSPRETVKLQFRMVTILVILENVASFNAFGGMILLRIQFFWVTLINRAIQNFRSA
jgi:hypothetical protein